MMDPTREIERLGQWLLSLGHDEVHLLHHTREYRDFIQSAHSLERAHRHIRTWHSMRMDNETGYLDVRHLMGQRNLSFLQHLAADDILMRIFSFLECSSLVHVSGLCSRFLELSRQNARDRTRELVRERQLVNVMQLLRAQEQIEGLNELGNRLHVRIPALLLSRRVQVSNAGDTEYNGIYHCTGSNGNGFVFTKPRYPPQRVYGRRRSSSFSSSSSTSLPEEIQADDSSRIGTGRSRHPSRLLRCIIAKRFSNETILWYMSKEVVPNQPGETASTGDITQIFSFWAKLMVSGDASPDICGYPSQTSILARNNPNGGWKNLSTTGNLGFGPPIVELVD